MKRIQRSWGQETHHPQLITDARKSWVVSSLPFRSPHFPRIASVIWYYWMILEISLSKGITLQNSLLNGKIPSCTAQPSGTLWNISTYILNTSVLQLCHPEYSQWHHVIPKFWRELRSFRQIKSYNPVHWERMSQEIDPAESCIFYLYELYCCEDEKFYILFHYLLEKPSIDEEMTPNSSKQKKREVEWRHIFIEISLTAKLGEYSGDILTLWVIGGNVISRSNMAGVRRLL